MITCMEKLREKSPKLHFSWWYISHNVSANNAVLFELLYLHLSPDFFT